MKLTYAICIFIFCCLVVPPTSDAEILEPYSGTVYDATTGKPIEGASVLFFWMKRVPDFEIVTELIDAKLTRTNAKGNYDLSLTFANAGRFSLDSTHVLIYEPGYQVYIKEIYHDSPYAKSDPEFRNHDNVVKLERIPPDFDHKAHCERIKQALWGLERHEYSDNKDVSWSGIVKTSMVVPLEKELFLRRVEWEQRRPGQEGRK